jgi:hypothetical protein
MMEVDYSVESRVHRRAASHHQACAEYHMQAADLIDKKEMLRAKALAKHVLVLLEHAQSATHAACVEDMGWEA